VYSWLAVKSLLRRLQQKFVPGGTVEVYNCYSQAGEDRILSFLFNSMGIGHPSYIDIGAYKPQWGSNTYLFYLQGSRGVCIEPDPRLFESLRDGRPGDTCVNAAVSQNGEREVELYLFDEPSLNTVSHEEALKRHEAGEYHLIGSTKVPALRVEEIIETHFSELPEFISLDVEGLDYEILKGFDFEKYPVPVWVIETVNYSRTHIKERNGEINDLMEKKGYFVYGDTYINTVFVRQSWFSDGVKRA